MLLYSQNGKNFLHFEHQANFLPFTFDFAIFYLNGKNFYSIKEGFRLELEFLETSDGQVTMKVP